MTAVLLAYARQHPEIVTVLVFLAAVAAHVLVGALVHLLRLHDFDWHHVGAFVEDDLASTRARVIATTFVLTLLTTTIPGGDWSQAFAPAFATLVAASAAATLPIIRDTFYELLELMTGLASTTTTTPPAG